MLSFNFTDLEMYTDYCLYYLATNEDPRFLLDRTSILETSTTTWYVPEETSFDSMLSTSISGILILFTLIYRFM